MERQRSRSQPDIPIEMLRCLGVSEPTAPAHAPEPTAHAHAPEPTPSLSPSTMTTSSTETVFHVAREKIDRNGIKWLLLEGTTEWVLASDYSEVTPDEVSSRAPENGIMDLEISGNIPTIESLELDKDLLDFLDELFKD